MRQISRLLPPLSRDKSHMLMLLAASLLVLLPHLLHVSHVIAGSVLLLMGWRGWIVVTGRRLPPRWLLLPVAVAAMGGIWLTYRTFFRPRRGCRDADFFAGAKAA